MQKSIKIKTNISSPHPSAVLIIYTGGTFGMTYSKQGVLMTPYDFSDILNQLPELVRFDMELTFTSIDAPTDSSNFNTNHWIEVGEIIFRNYAAYDGFVVLHGTDTMAYSASALSFLLEGLSKPVIFTGAQLPIGVARTDARENFITSLEIASAKENGISRVREVCIYFDYYLLRGNRSKKVQSTHFDAFVSENYPILAEAGVNIEYHPSYLNIPNDKKLLFHSQLNTNIISIKLFPGIQENYLRSIINIPGVEGIVLETYGAGNAPKEPWLLKIIQEAVSKGIIIMNVSQCLGGKVVQGNYDTSIELKNLGVVSGGNITFEAAVAKLMFVLGHKEYKLNPLYFLAQPLRGEM